MVRDARPIRPGAVLADNTLTAELASVCEDGCAIALETVSELDPDCRAAAPGRHASGQSGSGAAIDRHRTALAAYTTATDDDQVGDAGNSHCDALANLLETKPTTVAGCAAVLRYVQGLVRDGHGGMFDECGLFEGWYEPVSEPARHFLGLIAEALASGDRLPVP
jgi:hypothetical protein